MLFSVFPTATPSPITMVKWGEVEKQKGRGRLYREPGVSRLPCISYPASSARVW